MSALGKKLLSRFDVLNSRLTNFRTSWDENARYACPKLRSSVGVYSATPGAEQGFDIYDSTAIEALRVFSSGVSGGLIPSGEAWFRLEPATANADSLPLSEWLSLCSDVLFKTLAQSNFYLRALHFFRDLGAFGNAAMFVGEGVKTGTLDFYRIPVGSYVLELSSNEKPCALYRKYKLTALQIAEEFDAATLPLAVTAALESEQSRNTEFEVLHALYGRDGCSGAGHAVSANKRPWASVYVFAQTCEILREDGYYERPFVVARFDVSDDEVMGRGPMDDAIFDVRLLNSVERAIDTSALRALNPPMLAPENHPYAIDLRCSAINYYDLNSGPASIQPLNTGARVDVADSRQERRRTAVRQFFYTQLFSMFTNDGELRRVKTATEIFEMQKEKLLLFAPIYMRIVEEFLTPVLERSFSVLFRAGAFPPVPALKDADYRVSYVSKLSLALKIAQAAGSESTLEFVSRVAAIDPSVTKVVDWRQAVRDYASARGVSASLLRPSAEIDAELAAEAQAAQMAQMLQAANAGSQAVRNLGPGAQQAATEALQQGDGGLEQ